MAVDHTPPEPEDLSSLPLKGVLYMGRNVGMGVDLTLEGEAVEPAQALPRVTEARLIGHVGDTPQATITVAGEHGHTDVRFGVYNLVAELVPLRAQANGIDAAKVPTILAMLSGTSLAGQDKPTGERLYSVFCVAMAAADVTYSSWHELDRLEQDAWSAVATFVGAVH